MVAMEDGARLRTWTSGAVSEHAAVVLLHGGPGLWDYLAPVAEMLEPLTLVHRFDQRGCGGSDPASEYTIDRYLADIDALRRHWGYPTWIVIGHSFGATLAFAYAVAHPSHTAAMGYLSGVGVGDWRTSYQAERLRRMSRDQSERLVCLERTVPRDDAQETEFRVLSWFTDYADPVHGWDFATADASVSHPINFDANRVLSAEARTWDEQETLAQARQLAMPCWFVHGSRDPRPSSTVARLADAVAHAELHLIAGAGHKPWIERPDHLREILTRCVESATL